MRLSKFILANVKSFQKSFCIRPTSRSLSILPFMQHDTRFGLFSSINSRHFHRLNAVVLKKIKETSELVKKQRTSVGLPPVGEPVIVDEEDERREREEKIRAERDALQFETVKERREKKEQRKREYRQQFQADGASLSKEFFEEVKDKNKENFLAALHVFTTRDRILRGHVEFIHAALKCMRMFGVHRDLECYKKLIDVFPKGKMVARNIYQVEYMHYPKQQFCAIDVLQQMEDNAVMPDSEVEELLANIFGSRSFPSRKYARMMYWMPKFKYLSPWPLPDELPWDSLELIKLAIKRITSVDLQTKITIYKTEDLEDAVDQTWIVSGQSPDQQELIEQHPADRPIYVEGAFRVWISDQCVNYFILRSEPQPQPEVEKADTEDVGILFHMFQEDYKENKAIIRAPLVHEQDDGIILAVCATGTSSKDSLVSWINFMKDSNPRLGKDISVLFTLKSPIGPTDNLDVITEEEAEKLDAIGEKKDSSLVGPGLGFDPKRPELSQVGINPLSNTRFVNWPHHFNRPPEPYEDEENEKLTGKPDVRNIGRTQSSDTAKLNP